ncbi:ABC transporter substrate-binding protein [Ferrimonas lipolytica]|uniref:ABC transporter substrate-binding protein n=1 Tax=Ferrimonas lipolytica TaxID=2724191 RepID=A0A6H1UB57_9GAMM|nr:helical backbone metal receptor [Ferrimonas lipolytica]QIZ76291.1 ABC transporter substrate-binding protein [Ferrimonas lipolytica]
MRYFRWFSRFSIALLLLQTQLVWAEAQRVVSLAPNWSHTVAEVGAIERLVGVTRYARFPAAIPAKVEAGELAVVGGFTDIDVDTVVGLKPDLVLTATGLQRQLAQQLREQGLTVIHMDESSLDEIYRKIAKLGEALALAENAEALNESIQSELALIAQQHTNTIRPKVYYELNYYYKCVPGSDSYITELMELIGAEPILADGKGIAPMVTWPQVVAANPDVILIPTWPDAQPPVFEGPNAGNGTTTIDEVASRDDANQVSAVQADAIRFIDSARTKQAGPSIPEAARLLAQAIYGNTIL